MVHSEGLLQHTETRRSLEHQIKEKELERINEFSKQRKDDNPPSQKS